MIRCNLASEARAQCSEERDIFVSGGGSIEAWDRDREAGDALAPHGTVDDDVMPGGVGQYLEGEQYLEDGQHLEDGQYLEDGHHDYLEDGKYLEDGQYLEGECSLSKGIGALFWPPWGASRDYHCDEFDDAFAIMSVSFMWSFLFIACLASPWT
jgi:hypothetical protein